MNIIRRTHVITNDHNELPACPPMVINANPQNSFPKRALTSRIRLLRKGSTQTFLAKQNLKPAFSYLPQNTRFKQGRAKAILPPQPNPNCLLNAKFDALIFSASP